MHQNPATSLAASLAARRIVYRPPLATGPRVLVIDVPPQHRGRGLALGRYYPIVIETDEELDELERSLLAPRTGSALPDLLDHRPSNLWTDAILIMRFEPPVPSWPWLSIVGWPSQMIDVAGKHGIAVARGTYTMEMFVTSSELDAHCAALVEQLGRMSPSEIRLVAGDSLAGMGSA